MPLLEFFPAPPAPERAIDPHWKCQRSGDCCEKTPEVVMTPQEARRLVFLAPPTVTLQFREAGEGFVAMKAGPCPLFAFHSCMVYENRPYNCRRFGCMRPDVKAEPFEPDGGNMVARVRVSRVARRMAQRMQRKAQGWAQRHGWKVTRESGDH